MADLTFKLKQAPEQRLDLSQLTPSRLADLSLNDIANLELGTTRVSTRVGDIFELSGKPGESLQFDGGSTKFDFLGSHLSGGQIHVDGDVGAYAGRKMSSGTVTITGNAETYLASAMGGGLITVSGTAGDLVGAPRRGERFGMMGGAVVVSGAIGERAGDRMRRGTILTHSTCGANAASRMMGGTIWAVGGFGDHPGVLMRRGTLIGPSVTKLLATFNDCGTHDLLVLTLLQAYLRDTLGKLAPVTISSAPRKFAGDSATIGKGELLLIN